MNNDENNKHVKECPNCFYKLGIEDVSVCPNCDQDLTVDYKAQKLQAQLKNRYTLIKRIVQVALVLLIVACAFMVWHFTGKWWLMLISVGVGAVLSFVVLFIMELLIWYKAVRPFEQTDDAEDSDSSEN